MILNNEELEKIKSMVPAWITDDIINAVFAKFPENAPKGFIMGMAVPALKAVPKNMPAENIPDMIMKGLEQAKNANDPKSAGNSNTIVRNYYDSLLVEMRLMCTQKPDLKKEIFGRTYPTPIMNAAMSHLSTHYPGSESPMITYARAAKETGIMHWVGMCENDEFEAIAKIGADTVRIIKPYADNAKVLDQIAFAEKCGAIAVGVDIDHTFASNGELDVVEGEPMEAKTYDQYKEYIESTNLPFIIKGVLSVRDALMCKELGVKGIVVSHHGGRIRYAVPPIAVLPEIRKAVGDDMVIFVDCGVSSGYDAYKALALGADGVSIGKHLMPLVMKDSPVECIARINAINDELRGMMAYTGVENCNEFDSSVLRTI